MQENSFRVADLQQKCFGISLDMIRVVLKKLRQEKKSDAWAEVGMPNGKRHPNGNWVIPDQLGNELGI